MFEDSEVYYDENHRKNYKNNDILINILSEMLLNNKSITKLSIKYNISISYETFIKFCNAIKNHNVFYSLKIFFGNFKYVNMYNIFLESLKNHIYLCSLKLPYTNDKFIDLLKNLKYIHNLTFFKYSDCSFINKRFFEALENKKYLKNYILIVMINIQIILILL